MPTRLMKAVIRDVPADYYSVRPDSPDLVVKIDKIGIWVREKKRHTWYGPVLWGHVYQDAASITAIARLDTPARGRRKRTRVRRGLL